MSRVKNDVVSNKSLIHLILGFILILLLMSALIMLGLYYLKKTQYDIDQLVYHSTLKNSYIFNMRLAARGRVVGLHGLVIHEDPFKQDDALMSLQENGGIFLDNRDKLSALLDTEEEQRLLKKQIEAAVEFSKALQPIIELAFSNQREEAYELVLEKGAPLQQKVVSILDEMGAVIQREMEATVQQAEENYNKAFRNMWILFAIIFLISIYIMYYVIQHNRRYTAILEKQVLKRTEKLNEAREEAEAAAHVKARFLANMSHEIRTPLNAVIGMGDMLRDTRLDEEQLDCVDTLRNSSETLLTLINDILDFSKIEVGKLKLEKRTIDLRDCVEMALKQVSNRAASKGLNLSYDYADAVPQSIVGDSTRIQQVLINLLSNAVKFTCEGRIHLEVESLEQHGSQHKIRFAVHDSGIGISQENLVNLFQPFTQADESTTRKFGGTGLGLTISKNLSELMGGEISVQSKLDQGSCFYFSIVAESTAETPKHVLYEPHPQLKQIRIAVMHCLPEEEALLKKQLQRWGMQIVTQNDTLDALLFDADTIQNIHTLPDYCPRIALSYLCNQHAYETYQGCLAKPIRPVRLLDTLLKVLHKSSLQASLTATPAKATASLKPNCAWRILLVDDNAVNLKVAQLQLKKLGCLCDTATDGLDALRCLRQKNYDYDVVFMDMQMPNMDGLTATHTIREECSDEDCPYIIAMTANAMPEDEDKCRQAGMHDYISKPVKMDKLQAALQRAQAFFEDNV